MKKILFFSNTQCPKTIKCISDAIRATPFFKDSQISLCITKRKEINLETIKTNPGVTVIFDLHSIGRDAVKSYIKDFKKVSISYYGFGKGKLRIAGLKIFSNLEEIKKQIMPEEAAA